MWNDYALRADLEVCERLGIPLRRLHGWEPATTTSYRYDANGQVLETHTTKEPEWDQWDHYLMVALEDYRRQALCPGCGQPLADCMADDSVPDDQMPLLSAKRYEAGYNRCISCYRLEYEQNVLSDMHKNAKIPPPTGHLKWYVHRL